MLPSGAVLSLTTVLLLAQTSVTLQDPNSVAKAKVNASTGGALQVYCVGGTCGGSSDGGAVSQGAPAGVGNAWPIKVTDGIDTADVSSASALKVDGSAVTQPVTTAFTARADTFTGTASGTTVNASTAPPKSFAIQVKGTGAAPTSWDVRLEGSLDNTNFTAVLTHTNTTGDGVVLYSGAALSPNMYYRSRVAAVTLGSASNIVVTILGVQ